MMLRGKFRSILLKSVSYPSFIKGHHLKTPLLTGLNLIKVIMKKDSEFPVSFFKDLKFLYNQHDHGASYNSVGDS